MEKLSVSIVLHNTPLEDIKQAIDSFKNAPSPVEIFLLDNSSNDNLLCLSHDDRVNYVKSTNEGFGAGHNHLIKQYDLLHNYDYHLVMNPDIKFNFDVLSEMIGFMETNREVGVVMPRILNDDGSLQYARRLLPSPIDIFFKRFLPNSSLNSKYEIREIEPIQPVEIVALCGCFLLFRTDTLKSVGLFDKNFFMYFEDFDLCRRISHHHKTIYYPIIEVTHGANREHRRNLKLFFYSIQSTFIYFYKWGFVDKSRKKINSKIFQLIKDAAMTK